MLATEELDAGVVKEPTMYDLLCISPPISCSHGAPTGVERGRGEDHVGRGVAGWPPGREEIRRRRIAHRVRRAWSSLAAPAVCLLRGEKEAPLGLRHADARRRRGSRPPYRRRARAGTHSCGRRYCSRRRRPGSRAPWKRSGVQI